VVALSAGSSRNDLIVFDNECNIIYRLRNRNQGGLAFLPRVEAMFYSIRRLQTGFTL
jgi:hypothetical protein